MMTAEIIAFGKTGPAAKVAKARRRRRRSRDDSWPHIRRQRLETLQTHLADMKRGCDALQRILYAASATNDLASVALPALREIQSTAHWTASSVESILEREPKA